MGEVGNANLVNNEVVCVSSGSSEQGPRKMQPEQRRKIDEDNTVRRLTPISGQNGKHFQKNS